MQKMSRLSIALAMALRETFFDSFLQQ